MDINYNIVNQRGQLFQKEEGNDEAEFHLVDNIPKLRTNLDVMGRFFLTEDDQLFDADYKIVIPYSSNPKNLATFIDLIPDGADGTLWLLRSDGTVLQYTPTYDDPSHHYIRSNSKIISRQVDGIGRTLSGNRFLIVGDDLLIVEVEVEGGGHEFHELKLRHKIVELRDGQIITEKGIAILYNGWSPEEQRRVRIQYAPLIGDHITYGIIADSGLDILVAHIDERKVDLTYTTFQDNVLEHPTTEDLDTRLVNQFAEISPWIGGFTIDRRPYIYNAEGIIVTMDSHGGIVAPPIEIPTEIFKHKFIPTKNARKLNK
jgi:hypothetical protein